MWSRQVDCYCTMCRFVQAYSAPPLGQFGLSVCPQWFWLMCNPKPDAPPLHPASGDLAAHCAWGVTHVSSCAPLCVVTPPAGQTQAPASQTNPDNYQTLQSRFPEKETQDRTQDSSHQNVWPDEGAKVASRKSTQMCLPPPSVMILKLDTFLSA